MFEALGLVRTLALMPWHIFWELFGPDDFDRAIAEQAADLQRLADNYL